MERPRTNAESRVTGGMLAPVAAALGLAAALASAVLLGPLAFGVIDWRISANSLNQTLGADGAALLLLVPASLLTAWFARNRRPVAAPFAFGVGLAAAYYGIASVLGADYVQYAGNNERFFLLFLAIIVLSWTLAVWGWSAMGTDPPRPGPRIARATLIVFVAGGMAIAAAWVAQLSTIAITGGLTQPADVQAYAEAPTAFWVVRIVDLGFIVPLAIWAGLGLWRDTDAAAKAATGVAAFMTLQASAVLAMGAIMLARHDPTATPGLVVVLAPITVALGAVTLHLLHAYAGEPGPARGAGESIPTHGRRERTFSPTPTTRSDRGGIPMRHVASRGLLAVLTAFLSITAIAGAVFVVPTLPPEWLAGSIFADYTIPAVALACVGGMCVVAFGAVLLRPQIAGAASIAAGLAMVAFELVEIWAVGLSLIEYGASEPVAWLQVAYVAIGLLTAGAGLSLWRATAPDGGRLTTPTHVSP